MRSGGSPASFRWRPQRARSTGPARSTTSSGGCGSRRSSASNTSSSTTTGWRRATNTYYATVHVPATVAFLVWLFVRHRDHYPHWRNGLAIVTGFCLVIRFVRVAPPRFLPDLGYIDLSAKYGMSVYGPVGTGVSDQFAAMPSIHVAWAAVVSFGIIAASPSKWRWVFALQVILTMLAVSATGNHWWLDGIVAIALLGDRPRHRHGRASRSHDVEAPDPAHASPSPSPPRHVGADVMATSTGALPVDGGTIDREWATPTRRRRVSALPEHRGVTRAAPR